MVFVYKHLRWDWNIRKYWIIILACELICSSCKVIVISLNNHFCRKVVLHKNHFRRRVRKHLHSRDAVHISHSKTILLILYSILWSIFLRTIGGIKYLQCFKAIDGHDVSQGPAQTQRSAGERRGILWLLSELVWVLLWVVQVARQVFQGLAWFVSWAIPCILWMWVDIVQLLL